MRAGRLRHRVEIEQRTLASADSVGHAEATWQRLGFVWGEALKVGGGESVSAGQVHAESTWTVRMRKPTQAIETCRLILRSGPSERVTTLEPISVADVDGRDREVLVACREVI